MPIAGLGLVILPDGLVEPVSKPLPGSAAA